MASREPPEELSLSDPTASPRASRLAAPGWLDGRLVLGLLLVLVSVVVGARVLSSADRSTLVWAASKELTAGTLLAAGDLEPVRVRLFESAAQYVGADGQPPVGYVVRRGLGAGELLPQGALTEPERGAEVRLVTVPVEAGHYPPTLRDDQRVDLWVTPQLDADPAADDAAATTDETTSADPAAPAEPETGPLVLRGAQQVLSQVVVAAGPVQDDLAGAGGTVPIVLQVRPQDVDEVVSAMGLGRLDLVRVPRAAEARGDVAPPGEVG
jgi:hypothetical protein